MLCKKNTVAKSKEAKTGWSNFQEQTNLAQSSKKGYDSKRDVLPMMMNIDIGKMHHAVTLPQLVTGRKPNDATKLTGLLT
jgi:hypothetical protein